MIQEVDGKTDRGFINSFVTNDLLMLDTRDDKKSHQNSKSRYGYEI